MNMDLELELNLTASSILMDLDFAISV